MPAVDGVLRPVPGDPGRVGACLPVCRGPDQHAANLAVLDDGTLLCAWFAGSGEGNPDTDVVLSRLEPSAPGWSRPEDLSADRERSEQNPVVFQAPGGVVWLLHTSNEPHDQKTARVLARRSGDGGRTWTGPEVLFPGPGLFLRHPPLILGPSEWVLPAYRCTRLGDYTVMLRTSDGGATWQERPLDGSTGRVQACLLPRSDGTLLALFRSRAADRLYAATSPDRGRTWSAPVPTALPNNNASVQAAALPGGLFVLAFNDATLERDQFRWVSRGDAWRKKPLRTPLQLALSEDEGRTWPWRRNLQTWEPAHRDDPTGYSYPSVAAGGAGVVHVAFSYLRRAIRYERLPVDWIRGGAVRPSRGGAPAPADLAGGAAP